MSAANYAIHYLSGGDCYLSLIIRCCLQLKFSLCTITRSPRNAVPLAVARKPLRAVRAHPRAQGIQAPSTGVTLLQVAIQTSLAIRRWHKAGRTLVLPATLYRYAIQPVQCVCRHPAPPKQHFNLSLSS